MDSSGRGPLRVPGFNSCPIDKEVEVHPRLSQQGWKRTRAFCPWCFRLGR